MRGVDCGGSKSKEQLIAEEGLSEGWGGGGERWVVVPRTGRRRGCEDTRPPCCQHGTPGPGSPGV